MTHRHAAVLFSLLLTLPPALAGCRDTAADPAAVSAAGGSAMTVHGLQVVRIDPGHRVVLSDGLEIAGDARLAEALAGGGGGAIRDLTVLERFPPVFVVTFADGETRRYQSRKIAP